MEDLEKLFNEDVKEKKTAARGVRNRASRTGKISKVNLPSDFLGSEYKRSTKPVSFSVDDVLYILQETPTLKELLMQRLDAEYQNYALAISRTIDAVARIQERALEAVLVRIDAIQSDLRYLEKENERLAKLLKVTPQKRNEARTRTGRVGRPRKHPITSTEVMEVTEAQNLNESGTQDQFILVERKVSSSHKSSRFEGRRPRTLEELKTKVFRKLDEIIEMENDLRFKTVNSCFPGIKYYIYQLKVWDNYDSLIQEYLGQKNAAPSETDPSVEMNRAITDLVNA